MRIYTEVNFKWDDKKGKLVELSSDSFDYSGEMALCDYTNDVSEVYYDAAGNRWEIQMDLGWSLPGHADEATAERYLKNGGTVDAWDAHLTGDNAQEFRKTKFRAWVYGRGDFVASNEGNKLFRDEAELDTYWETEYHETRPESLPEAEDSVVNRFQSEDYTYAGGDWQKISDIEGEAGWAEDTETGTWTFTPPEEQTQAIQDLIDSEEYDETYDLNKDDVIDALDLEVLGTPGGTQTLSTDVAKAAAQSAIEGYIKNWKEIVEPGGYDAVEELAKGHIRALEVKERDVLTAYEDIFGAEGSIFDIEETWETAEERAETKYTTDIGTALTAKEEGLEGTVTGREGELEALREEAGGNIRAAEAKIGAAGFASTGVGRTARDVLAEEIGGAARGIDEGFTEERSDVKRQYLETVDPLKEKFGAGGTAYEDYIRDRDDAAKREIKPWQTASEEYNIAKEAYETETVPSLTSPSSEYMGELEFLGGGIASVISGITQEIGGVDPLDEDWNPFETDYLKGLTDLSGEAYSYASFGIDPNTMTFTNVPDAAVTAPFYEAYSGDITGQLYDPEKTLPWEDPTAPDGEPYKPGGQR